MLEIIVRRTNTAAGYEASRRPVIVSSSEQPLLDGARVLQRRGVPDNTIVTMRHADATAWALRSTIGVAAGLTVSERRLHFRKFREFDAR